MRLRVANVLHHKCLFLFGLKLQQVEMSKADSFQTAKTKNYFEVVLTLKFL